VREVQLKSLRGQILDRAAGAVPVPDHDREQHCLRAAGASREEVEGAARAANAHAFIERLPTGTNTVLGSGVGRCRVGRGSGCPIARALLKDAPVLILDEPTSALDAETEGALLVALRRLVAAAPPSSSLTGSRPYGARIRSLVAG
jgi:ATP-binding cassette subfamily B protein/subfamily B ATP-binding cassette protein MsbA